MVLMEWDNKGENAIKISRNGKNYLIFELIRDKFPE